MLKLINVEMVNGLITIWVKWLCEVTPQKWKTALTVFYYNNNLQKAAPAVFNNTSSFSDYFSYNQNPIVNISQFYQYTQKYWSQVQTVETCIAKEIFNRIIWNNRYITTKNKPFQWKTWVMKSITKIGDITDDQGMFLSYSEINQKFNLECNFLEVLQITQSIPSRWREVIYDVTKCLIDTNVIYCNNGKIQYISKTTCKDVNWNFVTKRRRVPRCCEKWAEYYPNFKKANNMWPNIFKLSFNTTRET